MIYPLCVSGSLVCDMSVSVGTSYLLYFFSSPIMLSIFSPSSIALFFSPSRFYSCTSLSYLPPFFFFFFAGLSRINKPPHFSAPFTQTNTQAHTPPTHSVYLVNLFYLPGLFIQDCGPDWFKVKACLSQVVVYHHLLCHSGVNHNYKSDRI